MSVPKNPFGEIQKIFVGVNDGKFMPKVPRMHVCTECLRVMNNETGLPEPRKCVQLKSGGYAWGCEWHVKQARERQELARLKAETQAQDQSQSKNGNVTRHARSRTWTP